LFCICTSHFKLWLVRSIVNINFNVSPHNFNSQNTNTRNKVLIAKKQKKAVPGKKGKRLGGNVKKAMKAEKAAKKIKK
jgi:hypothetical protein